MKFIKVTEVFDNQLLGEAKKVNELVKYINIESIITFNPAQDKIDPDYAKTYMMTIQRPKGMYLKETPEEVVVQINE